MTVCVSALCAEGIVSASDSMMSWGGQITSDDVSLKYDRLHLRWMSMLAGDDIHPAETIIRELRRSLNEYSTPTLNEVETCIRSSWQTVKNRIAETQVLSPYGMDTETFVHEGREMFGDIGFAELRARIERASELSCELLLAGFDEFDKGTLLMVVHPGEPVNFTRLGFAAIGSGRDSAIASLMWEPSHKSYHSTEASIYRVGAAKFMAETALGVGKDTTIFGLKSDGSSFALSIRETDVVRGLWEKEGRPKIPTPSKLAGPRCSADS